MDANNQQLPPGTGTVYASNDKLQTIADDILSAQKPQVERVADILRLDKDFTICRTHNGRIRQGTRIKCKFSHLGVNLFFRERAVRDA